MPDELPDADPGRGRRLGIDVGTVRIGVASSDPDCVLATPVETVARTPKTDEDVRRIVALVDEYEAVEVIVGRPRTLRGEDGKSSKMAGRFADVLARRIAPVPVRLVDERFSTVTAQRALRESGVRAKNQRSVVDQAAAVEILQSWLDERAQRLAAQRATDEDGQ
ncbi:Holliday junction resolvase RuvX [Rhodococcus sp. D2-41]|uniref:Putative pre-16S rRNA nuclease n=1 Tax=Speluncibacter jeojiensis TaxID=2710754 RepID=A0A9X4M2Y6_9ACTN|nr:Holliday junction resolvase RuvX [Rhodococcus sp. D2-41]MDG3011276.1 Holliday junction resolvase RuvX [Rhodococcus sp. D2-41]MDG3015872.1 Holliday junction resolvase RuvX [Corynebacteriales bacterium D3-21]